MIFAVQGRRDGPRDKMTSSGWPFGGNLSEAGARSRRQREPPSCTPLSGYRPTMHPPSDARANGRKANGIAERNTARHAGRSAAFSLPARSRVWLGISGLRVCEPAAVAPPCLRSCRNRRCGMTLGARHGQTVGARGRVSAGLLRFRRLLCAACGIAGAVGAGAGSG